MGLFDRFFGLKKDDAAAKEIVRQYVEEKYEEFMLSWIGMSEDMQEFKELDKKDLLKDETARLAYEASELVKAEKIKPPGIVPLWVREILNDLVIDIARPHIQHFVQTYRNPYQPWPNEANIPLKDMEKLEKILKENGITIEVLYYDFPDSRVRQLLEQYEVRQRLANQDSDAWAKAFNYSHEDLVALGVALKDKNQRVQPIEHMLGDLRGLVKQELILQQDGQFQRSFTNAHPELPLKPTKDEWIKAYVKTFRNDIDYIDYLRRLARQRGVNFSKDEIQKMISAELQNKNKPVG